MKSPALSAIPAALALTLSLALAGCGEPTGSSEAIAPAASAPPAPESAAEPVVLQAAMKDVVKPQTEVVLNILIAALTSPPDPYVDAAKLTDGDWEIMETAATALRDEAVAMRDRPIQVVANPGDKLAGEVDLGTNGAVEVQGYIDAYPDHFAEDAEALRVKADEWLTAIQARDSAAMWQVALALDPVCVDCHEVFWSGDLDHITESDRDDH